MLKAHRTVHWRNWLLAMRPKTLPAAVAPLLVAIALAISSPYPSNPVLMGLAVLCALCLQILVNFSNDYSDAKSGVDTEQRIGPIRASQSGLISDQAMKHAMYLFALLALLTGLPLIAEGGIPFACLGICCILAAFAYSGGPFPLASHGLGEITVLIFFGFVAVVGGSYLFTGEFLRQSWLLALISGLPISAIMLVNNTRDMATDEPANKRTLPVRLGRDASNHLYTALLVVPQLIALGAVLLGMVHWSWSIAAVITWPSSRSLCTRFQMAQGQTFNPLLAATAQYSLFNSFAFSSALLLISVI